MQTGQYDVISASGDASLRLIAAGDVEPVNTALVPNYADIFDSSRTKPWNTVDGVNYGVPHGCGANLLMYRTDRSRPRPTLVARSSTRLGAARARSPPTTRRSTSPTPRCT